MTVGGFFHDCAVHDIDLICWIIGERPDTVFAQGHAFHDCIREMDDVDQANITLKFPSGTMATIDINREAVYGYDQRLEVRRCPDLQKKNCDTLKPDVFTTQLLFTEFFFLLF